MKSLIFLGLVLATATIATAQVAHADLSKCIPIMAKEMNDTQHADPISAQKDMAKTWQCIQSNNQTKS
jgi:hypothetical protein